MIAFADDTSTGMAAVYDGTGNTVTGLFPFAPYSQNIYAINSAAFTNGNYAITFIDGSAESRGMLAIFDTSGNTVSAPAVFGGLSTQNIFLDIMANGNILIVCSYTENDISKTEALIYSSLGESISDPEPFSSVQSVSAMKNGSIFLTYTENEGSKFQVLRKRGLELEKVSSNEVRLWNYTGETLDLILSAE